MHVEKSCSSRRWPLLLNVKAERAVFGRQISLGYQLFQLERNKGILTLLDLLDCIEGNSKIVMEIPLLLGRCPDLPQGIRIVKRSDDFVRFCNFHSLGGVVFSRVTACLFSFKGNEKY